ncbi:GyrI-like domain-containing protein [Peribacillus sp. SCS-26]|uniref:GyrI-like domain-containing protein n=1 Tax=Paraperibacillus marinus TaxID=3115295 RepID=UPI003905CA91
MPFTIVHQTFKSVGIKNRGRFSEFASVVPKNAQKFMSRRDELEDHSGTEIAFFEPKRGEDHLEGGYYVGITATRKPGEVPSGMEYLEITHTYAAARGEISEIGSLHSRLNDWIFEQGRHVNQEAYFVELYFPKEDGEEVEVYIPIQE